MFRQFKGQTPGLLLFWRNYFFEAGVLSANPGTRENSVSEVLAPGSNLLPNAFNLEASFLSFTSYSIVTVAFFVLSIPLPRSCIASAITLFITSMLTHAGFGNSTITVSVTVS